jgi:glycosyltransferase involved in cell wall biosynthesis
VKILLIANYLPDGQQSARRFEQILFVALTRLGHQVRVIRPRRILGCGKWMGYVDKFILFIPALLRAKRWADVVHVLDHSNAMVAYFLGDVPHVVTCNDLLAIRSARGEFQENPTHLTGRIFQAMILSGLKKAKEVVCISEKTRADFSRLTGKPMGEVEVIPMAVDSFYVREVIEPPDHPFFLHVGGNQWYKNRGMALKIFECLRKEPLFENFELVMAGKPFTKAMRSFIQERGLKTKVIEKIDPSDEVLRALYSTATALIFPSLEEGLGWPILEAQACGCPVFVSDRSPMKETAGEGGVWIDPLSPQKAADQILKSFSALQTLGYAAVQNARRFSQAQMAARYVEIYDKARRKS